VISDLDSAPHRKLINYCPLITDYFKKRAGGRNSVLPPAMRFD